MDVINILQFVDKNMVVCQNSDRSKQPGGDLAWRSQAAVHKERGVLKMMFHLSILPSVLLLPNKLQGISDTDSGTLC